MLPSRYENTIEMDTVQDSGIAENDRLRETSWNKIQEKLENS